MGAATCKLNMSSVPYHKPESYFINRGLRALAMLIHAMCDKSKAKTEMVWPNCLSVSEVAILRSDWSMGKVKRSDWRRT